MTIKRSIWIWIVGMVPVMWGLLKLVIWADRLYQWQYSENYARPTPADFTRAAVVFWSASLIPLAVGLVTGAMAFRRKCPARWPVPEIVIVAIPYLALLTGTLSGALYASGSAFNAYWFVMMWASLFVGGAVVVSLLNLGACARERMWGKLALSVLPLGAGMLYLLWLNAFIIYIDT